jgi:hypothetical protein
MRRLSSAVLALVLVGFVPSLRAADDPRAVVEQALKALGGEEAVKQRGSTQVTVKGNTHPPHGASYAFTGTYATQTGGKSRWAMQADINGQPYEWLRVSDGDTVWMRSGGETRTLEGAELAALRTSWHQDRVVHLLPLLHDKAFTLTALEEGRVEDRPVRRIRVAHAGQPDLELSFDKETGLLVRSAYRGPQPGMPGERLFEMAFTDYREPDPAAEPLRVLRAAGIETEGAALVEFLRRHTTTPAQRERVKALIRELDDDAFEVRERATAELGKLGRVAAPLLEEAARGTSAEVARRASQLLAKIKDRGDDALVATVRLLALRRPDGAAEALLDHLPAAGGPLAREIKSALYALGQRKGGPDEALVKALQDKDPARKAAAEAALGKDGGAYEKEPGRRLYPPSKRAMKMVRYLDGQKLADYETIEVQYFNRFEDNLFARP